MPIDSELQAAGRRAAAQPVPPAPSIEIIEAGAAKHTSRRRVVLSSAAALVLVALAFPLALTMRGRSTVQTVAAGTGQASAAQVDPVPAAAQQDPDNTEEGVRIELRSGNDFALSIRVLSGDEAVGAGEAAARDANETLEVDGLTVWVSGTGDERRVSALVEPREFVEVTGSGAELDMLIDVLRNGGLTDRGGRHGLHNLDDPEWQQFFEKFDGGDFTIDVDGLDLDELMKDFDELDELFGPNGEFDKFFGPDGGFMFDRDGFSFDGDFSEFFGPDGGFNLDRDGFSLDGDFSEFFGSDGEFSFPSGLFGESFDGCIVIDRSAGDDDESMRIEIPEGCSSTG